MSARAILKHFGEAKAAATVVTEATSTGVGFIANLKTTSSLQVIRSKEARVVGYARRSSKKDGSDSIDRQRRELEEYSMRRFGRPLDQFYHDASISGRTANRPGLKQLLQDAAGGRFTHIIVEDIDRIARTLRIAAEFKEQCDGWGIVIHSAYKGAAIEDSDVAIRGFLSADQVRVMRERSMEGKRKKVENGQAIGLMPFGYIRASNNKGDWKIDETKRHLIESIFHARIDGMGLHVMARILNAREITQKTGHGNWTTASVKDLICNPKYMGVHVYGVASSRLDPKNGKQVVTPNPSENWVVKDVPEWAVVSKNKWNAAFESLNKPTQQKLVRPHTLLNSEHTTCANCGWKMRSVRVLKEDVWDLRCTQGNCRERSGHKVSFVEDQMLRAVKVVLDDPRYDAAFEEQLELEHDRISRELAERRASTEKLVQELDDELEVLLDLGFDLKKRKRLDSNVEKDELHSFESERLTRRVDRTKSKLRSAQYQLAMLPDVPERFDRTKRAHLLQAYERIVASRSSNEPRADVDEQLICEAEAAIGNLVKSVKIGTIYPGRVATYQIEMRLQPIFGDMVADIDGGCRTITKRVHPAALSHTDRGIFANEASNAFANRVHGSSDEQFATLEAALSPQIRAKLAMTSWTPRDFVDLVLLVAKCSVTAQFLRLSMPRNDAKTVWTILRASLSGGDGTWARLFAIMERQYPHLYAEMDPHGFPNQVAARRTADNQKYRRRVAAISTSDRAKALARRRAVRARRKPRPFFEI